MEFWSPKDICKTQGVVSIGGGLSISVRMCSGSFAKCLGITLMPLSIVCVLCNILLFFPSGTSVASEHITEQVWYFGGILGSGVLVSALKSWWSPLRHYWITFITEWKMHTAWYQLLLSSLKTNSLDSCDVFCIDFEILYLTTLTHDTIWSFVCRCRLLNTVNYKPTQWKLIRTSLICHYFHK